MSIDCNGRRVAADPYRGTVEAVLECASNLACVGAEPLGTTNNLNFGNPEKRAHRLAADRIGARPGRRLPGARAPIVGGNVSLYNEGATGPIYPTPVIGMVGRLPDAAAPGAWASPREGDAIALVGPFAPVAGGERARQAARRGRCPTGCRRSTSMRSRAAQAAVREAVRAGSLSSAHDIAEGGLAVALAECCLAGGLGARVVLRAMASSGAPVVDGAVRRGPRRLPGERSPRRPARARRAQPPLPPHADRQPSAGDSSARRAICCAEPPAGRLSRSRSSELATRRALRAPCGAALRLRASAPAALTASVLASMREGPRDECGVFGLYAPGHEVSRLSYFALYALQHRGQESAGIAAADRGGHIITRRELGLVSQVFTENDLRTLAGELAIGHVRYSTTGSNAWENSQPVQRSEGTNGSRRELALAHNGNLINAVELHDELLERGVTLQLHLGLGDHRRDDRHPPGRAASRTRSPTCCRACAARSRSWS